jgi:DNA-binding NarL/FixJ family response regulator
MAVIDVAIIEDQKAIREGLSYLLNSVPGFACRHAYESVEAALENIGRQPPVIVLMDIGLPGTDGIEGLRLLRGRYPGIAAVMLTVFKDDARVFQAICAGACGYLLKTTTPQRILEALREVADGGAAMSPEVAKRVMEAFRQNAPSPPPEAVPLTPQELRLLKLLTEGHRNKTAAAELGISVYTVGFHLRSIYSKLHVHSRSGAVARALKEKLLDNAG